jgi:rod shape-determining protein MreD
MVRAALGGSRINHGPKRLARFVPAASVVAASALALLPIVTGLGWVPDLGFLLLIAWRLLRSDAIPAWWAAPLGLVNDLITGAPVGLSMTIWTAAMLALDLLDRRTMWRDYWIEWALAALLLLAVPFSTLVPPLLIAILAFPLAAWCASALDRWRLGR